MSMAMTKSHRHPSITTTNQAIMSNVNFSDFEKQAIVSLIIEMINSDRVITIEEMYASNAINAELGITEEVFRAGMALDFDYAIELVKKMDTQRKCFVAQQLVRVMDADGADDAELNLFEEIGRRIGLDKELGCDTEQ